MANLIFGCGYLGMRVARRWLDAGETVHAMTRDPDRAAEFQRLGLRPILGDVTESFVLPRLTEVKTVLFAIGFDRSADASIEEVYVGGLRRVLDTLPDGLGRLIYVSSTGVYGDADGAWVDEETACHPTRAGGRACLDAERLLENHPLGQHAIVLRLAGIYGPGRVPREKSLAAGQPLSANPDSTLNLIHVEDAVRVILAARRLARPPTRYLVSDGQPVRRRDFYGYLAERIGASPPRFETPAPNSSSAARDRSDKRIRNDRMREELAVNLRFPSYREGLASIVRQRDREEGGRE